MRTFRLRLSFFFWMGLVVAIVLTLFGTWVVRAMEEQYRTHAGLESELSRAVAQLRYRDERLFSSLLLDAAGNDRKATARSISVMRETELLVDKAEALAEAMNSRALDALRGERRLLVREEERVLDLLAQDRSEEALAILRSGVFSTLRERFFASLAEADALIAKNHSEDMAIQMAWADRSVIAGCGLVLLLLVLWGTVFFQYRRYLNRLTRNQEELAEAKAQAEEANLAKSLFLASVSHELRTPLNAVLGFSQLLQDEHYGPLNEKQVEYVNDIVQSAFHLNVLISEILDLARVDSAQDGLLFGPVRPAELVDRALVLVRDRALQCGIRLESSVKDLPTVALDLSKIRQALLYMLDNMIRLSPRGGLVRLEARRVTKEEARRAGLEGGAWLLFVVEGESGGMSEQECLDVFKPFFKLPREAETGWSGIGSGLALVLKYARLHGGTAWIESEGAVGGVRIKLALPLRSGNEALHGGAEK